ncbi:hypothetical protein PBI_INGRID_53 [Arthrobacter phage Ingrid]|nr:hypothetical protein PBI_INGRID_53 [Arthrobacter phage Ingrid]QFG11034.1 hypothetical protein PBI_LORETTA_52 [Arthrobacter phage Loretta]
MSIHQMRAAVANAYPGGAWALRVQKMPDKQVYSTYMRLMNAGKL